MFRLRVDQVSMLRPFQPSVDLIVMAVMQEIAALQPFFNVEVMGRMNRCGYISHCPAASSGEEHQAMINRHNVVAALRRDVSFVWNAVIAVVFICFGSLALAAALLDLMSIHHH